MGAEYSYNGWLASKDPQRFGGLAILQVGTETFPPGVRAGDVHTVLSYVATQLNARVEPVAFPGGHPADDWGYNYRQNRNANNLSCHASGTAFDYNATRHPNGKKGTWTKEQVVEIRKILAEVNNVVKWGGDFSGTKDEMHFEIHGTNLQVQIAASRVSGQLSIPISPVAYETEVKSAPKPSIPGPGQILQYGDQGGEVVAWQGELWRIGYGVGVHDGIFGGATKEATRSFQIAAAIHIDTKVGPQTRAIAASVPNYPKPDGPALPLAVPDGPADTVRAFQQALKNRSWNITVDGKFGPETQKKLRQFQEEKGLTADGMGGPATWTALHTRQL